MRKSFHCQIISKIDSNTPSIPVSVSGQWAVVVVKRKKRRMDCLVKFSLCQTYNVNVIEEGKVGQFVKPAARCD